MSIPAFTNDGVMPPFLGAEPGMASNLMSPFEATVMEVAQTLGLDHNRITILLGWLEHRRLLREIGFAHGFQWVDGSFVEDKAPGDLDAVTFLYGGPPSFADQPSALEAADNAMHLFDRDVIKQTYRVDFLLIDLRDNPESLVNNSRYWFGLFSHQRDTMIWKGILQVRMENADADLEAVTYLQQQLALLPEPEIAVTQALLFEGGGTQ